MSLHGRQIRARSVLTSTLAAVHASAGWQQAVRRAEMVANCRRSVVDPRRSCESMGALTDVQGDEVDLAVRTSREELAHPRERVTSTASASACKTGVSS